ncbi:hypothetical protein RQP46_005548 [Phenoliferia psychrophenolica]
MDEPIGMLDLPPELRSKVFELLAPDDLRSLAQTHSSWIPDDKVWRDLVQDVLRLSDSSLDPTAAMSDGPFEIARFLLPRSRFLGWFVSSRAHNSRIIRLQATFDSPSQPTPDRTPTSTLTITASRFTPANAFESPNPPPVVLPLGCHIDPSGSAYNTPRQRGAPGSHTPDRGLSVDLLAPTYSFTPLFTITETSGAVLHNPGSIHALKVSLRPIDVDIALHPSPEDRAGRGDNLFNLFTGRLPKPSWPTRWMYGPERVGTSHGALRGLPDFMSARGDAGDVVKRVADGEVAKTMCEGFQIEPRKDSGNESAGPSSTTATPGANTPAPAQEDVGDDVPRRMRGAGPNGGMGILWQGADRDPEARPGVAVIRAGGGRDFGGQEFVFQVGDLDRMGGMPGGFQGTQRVPRAQLPEQETYLPIHPPSRPLAFDSPPTTDAAGSILAASLEGMWVGTYGAHGLELGQLSVRCTLPSEPSKPYGVDCPIPTESDLATPPQSSQVKRTLEFTKLTGDVNVPAGQISWVAELPPLDLSDYTSTNSLGTVPSVTNEILLRWSSYDPLTAAGPTPDWDSGTVAGAGHVAMPGFLQDAWIPAQLVFVRSTHKVTREIFSQDGTTSMETREMEVVEEIRLRWSELGKVGVFRRVRL